MMLGPAIRVCVCIAAMVLFGGMGCQSDRQSPGQLPAGDIDVTEGLRDLAGLRYRLQREKEKQVVRLPPAAVGPVHLYYHPGETMLLRVRVQPTPAWPTLMPVDDVEITSVKAASGPWIATGGDEWWRAVNLARVDGDPAWWQGATPTFHGELEFVNRCRHTLVLHHLLIRVGGSEYVWPGNDDAVQLIAEEPPVTDPTVIESLGFKDGDWNWLVWSESGQAASAIFGGHCQWVVLHELIGEGINDQASITTVHLYTKQPYDPSAGAIETVVFSEEHEWVPLEGGGHKAFGQAVIMQGDTLFVANGDPYDVVAMRTFWTGAYKAKDFSRLDNAMASPQHPDFGTTGEPLHFGFLRAGSSPSISRSETRLYFWHVKCKP